MEMLFFSIMTQVQSHSNNNYDDKMEISSV